MEYYKDNFLFYEKIYDENTIIYAKKYIINI